MKIIEINYTDLPGRRFNGHNLHLELNSRGIQSKNVVVKKEGNEENTISVTSEHEERIRWQIINTEQKISLQAMIDPFGKKIMNSDYFKSADLLHFHIWYFYFLSINNFKEMTKVKKSVWTIHDIWPLTGHCVAKGTCEKWKSGCVECPDLNVFFPMAKDNASKMWNIKKEAFSDLDIDIVVASDYMADLVKESPLLSGQKRIHKIPFGLDLTLFKPLDKNTSKIKLGIDAGDFVISLRAINVAYKGIEYIKKMLSVLKPKRKVTILTTQEKGLFDEFIGEYRVVDLGWIDNDSHLVDFYGASDVFLMPSIEDTFGLMAIEAMACGRPVIVFEGTALPSVSFAPDCGIAVKRYDSVGLANAVDRLMANEVECIERGRIGRRLAEKHYDIKAYFKKHIELYESILGSKGLYYEK